VAYSVPNLAQLRPLIVGWSTLCRADWARNDSVRTTHAVPACYATTTQFSGELPEAMRAASKHQSSTGDGAGDAPRGAELEISARETEIRRSG
jgi:hypothetical protein